MKKRDTVTAIILLTIALGTIVQAKRYSIGDLSEPLSGFFPFVLGILLGILSFALLAQAVKDKVKEKAPPWVGPGGWASLTVTVGVLFGIAIFFERLGYVICTFLLMVVLLWFIGARRWWTVIIIALMSSGGVYLIFGILLKTMLPLGPFESILRLY